MEGHQINNLFKQGASLKTTFFFFTLLSIAFIIIDNREGALKNFRSTLGALVYPIEIIASLPYEFADWFSGKVDAYQAQYQDQVTDYANRKGITLKELD